MHTAPSYLKWALVSEEPNNRTVWLAKATPRAWLTPGAAPVVVRRAPTRYGRVSFVLAAEAPKAGPALRVTANLSLPATYAGGGGPPGGLRLRLRAAAALAGRLARVTVGGEAWSAFDAHAETIDFGPGTLTAARIADMHRIVAEWDAA